MAKDMETKISAAEGELFAARQLLSRNETWTIDQYIAAAHVQAVLALARAVDKLTDTRR